MTRATMAEQVAVQEDPNVVLGRTLKRAKRIIFDIPESIRSQMKAAREKGMATSEYPVLLATRKLMKAHQVVLGSADATDQQIVSAVKSLRELAPQKENLSTAVQEAGREQRDRATELRTEVKTEKAELAKDFAHEVITALLK